MDITNMALLALYTIRMLQFRVLCAIKTWALKTGGSLVKIVFG